MGNISSRETDMVMGSKSKKHFVYYHQQLFILFLTFVWVTVGCFVYYQYRRERSFKMNFLNEHLQFINLQLLSYTSNGGQAAKFYREHHMFLQNMRITLIHKNGQVIYDSKNTQVEQDINHLSRPEVQNALKFGSAFAIRHSESTGHDYFYVATAGKNMIARTAVAYTVSLASSLDPARGFLWLMLGISILFSILGYFMTRHLGDNIKRLRDFARKAGAGEKIEPGEKYPHDELGEISTQIMKLYSRLLQTMDDRDKERQSALYEAHEKIRIKRELTNNINHELKTPLSAIKGYLETILSYPDMIEKQRDLFIQKSYEQTMRLTDLLRDVSTISRLEEGSISLKKERVNLMNIFNTLHQNMTRFPRPLRAQSQSRYPALAASNPIPEPKMTSPA